ncbi:MAG: LPXTG cell wall anchor domain-containing protein [Blautia sp.]
MWIHIVIFGILLVVFIGSKAGWFSSKKKKKTEAFLCFWQ